MLNDEPYWVLNAKCWCGERIATDGKRKWCTTQEDKKPHDKTNNEGMTNAKNAHEYYGGLSK